MSRKYSDPPWIEEEGFIISAGACNTVCDPRCMDASDPDNLIEMDANARLIAAAPDLLEALQKVEKWVAMYETCSGHEKAAYCMNTIVRAAIRKATGEE